MTMKRALPAVLLLALAGATLILGPSPVHAEAYEGYTLFGPNNGTSTYLVDMDNVEVYHWTHDRSGGYAAYLLRDGYLVRTAASSSSYFNGGGAQGIVQKYAPNLTKAWEYEYCSSLHRAHHDIEPMANGNVLVVAWEKKTAAEAEQAGLDQALEIWPDHIIEVEPSGTGGGTIIWEWHAWDHLIQDHDATKDNYGVVGDHPELLDINMGGGGGMGGGDWMHINGISYDETRDQIVISSHTLDEVYVIDHSTTTAEAASHAGGNSGMGGDILYRWGHPSNYDRSGSHYFDVVHCSVWISAGLSGAGDILAFNNRDGQGTSIVAEITPPRDGEYNYYIESGAAFGPAAPTWTFTASWFYSSHLGACQRLANGNTFVCESAYGNMFEVDAAGTTQWEYARGGEISRALRYGSTYPGLLPLGLGTGDVGDGQVGALQLVLGQNVPNPCGSRATIAYAVLTDGRVSLKLYDLLGREIRTLVDGAQSAGAGTATLSPGSLPCGIYFYTLKSGDRSVTRKLVVQR